MRQVESYLDDSSGLSSPRSPYAYDGSVNRAIPNNFSDRKPGSQFADGLARQQRRYEPIPARKDYRPPMSIPPRAVAKKVKPPRAAPGIPERPEIDEASKHLVPIGDTGLYGTPDDAASPSDCDRWPNSPACGKNPFTNVPVGFEDATIINDKCNKGARITPVLGFTKLPDIELVYREPECRKLPPDESGKQDWDIYDLPPEYTPPELPIKPRKCLPDFENVPCWVGVTYHTRDLTRTVYTGSRGIDVSLSSRQFTAKIKPPLDTLPTVTLFDPLNASYSFEGLPEIAANFEYEFKEQIYRAATGIYKDLLGAPTGERTTNRTLAYSGTKYLDKVFGVDFDKDGKVDEDRGRITKYIEEFDVYVAGQTQGFYLYNSFIVYGKFLDIKAYLETMSYSIITRYDRPHPDETINSWSRTDCSAQVAWVKVEGGELAFPPCPIPKPPPPKRKKCCMGCCPPGKNDDDKWKLIIQKLNSLQKDVDKVRKDIGEPEHCQYHEEKNTEVLKDYGFHRKSEKPTSLFKAFKFINERVNTIQLWGQRVKEAWHVLQPREFIDAKVPKKLIYPGAKGEEKVRGYADVGQVQIRQSDKSAGGWPIRIKVADTNPGKGGNQPVVMEVNSVADALRLLLESVIETGGDIDTHTNMLVRSLYMQAQTLQVTSVCEQYLENIEEWLDYPVEHFKLPVPMTISPLANPGKGFEQKVGQGLDNNTEAETEKLLPHLLQETHQNIRATRFKGGRTLNERLLEMFHHISVVSGTNSTRYQGIPALKTLIEAAVAARKMHGFLDRENLREALSSGDTDVILKEIEQGYETSAPERKETKSPYNKPQSERPRVKRVSKKRKSTDKTGV